MCGSALSDHLCFECKSIVEKEDGDFECQKRNIKRWNMMSFEIIFDCDDYEYSDRFEDKENENEN